WMNRWLKGEQGEVTESERPRFTPQQLKVFDRLPADAINTTVQETFIRPAHPELPPTSGDVGQWWEARRKEWLGALREKVSRGGPAKAPPPSARPAADVKHNGLRLRAFDFTSEEEVELRLWLLTAEKVDRPTLVVLSAVDEAGWQEWVK